MRTVITLLVYIIFVSTFPLTALATSHPAALNAGVINGVWFSNPNPEEGELVKIFTAVQNSSDETISGTVAFLVSGDIAGTSVFTVQSNDIISVSTEYIFEDGAYDVSAYITSVDDNSVVYTVVPDTSVSVTRRAPTVNTQPEIDNKNKNASSTLESITDIVTGSGKSILTNIDPVAESVAENVEEFRDSFLASTTTPAVESTGEKSAAVKVTVPTKKQAAQNFVNSSKTIVTTDGIPMWKKATGVLLSLLALIVRFWFIPLVLMILIIFWVLVRGRRIR